MNSIQFSFNTQTSETDTLILPVNDKGEIPEVVENITDRDVLATTVKSLFDNQDYSGKPSKTMLLIDPSKTQWHRVLLVGVGNLEKLTAKSYISIVKATADALDHCGTKTAVNALVFIAPQSIEEAALAWSTMQNTMIFQKSFYDYTHESRGEHQAKDPNLEQVIFPCSQQTSAALQGQSSAIGMALTQDLANMPSNFCTPTYLANTAEELAKTYGFESNILDRQQMLEIGMGAFMAVAQGSDTPPKMICLSYQGADADQAPIALVGKGVTFDTGGISLKPGAAMDEMKYDMGGAATVLGVFKAIGELKPNINVVGVIPSTENMPSGNAVKPGDVVTSLSGQTIEILNTDAEGRLILCDALTYVQQTYKPAKIIDMATLTGACIIALGHHVSAVLGNNQQLVDQIRASGERTYDRFWQLPLGEEWDEQLKSNFADMANIGGRPAGTITAAQFLARYTKDINWAHLDIAGTAWVSGSNKGATGRPVPALVDFLLKQAN